MNGYLAVVFNMDLQGSNHKGPLWDIRYSKLCMSYDSLLDHIHIVIILNTPGHTGSIKILVVWVFHLPMGKALYIVHAPTYVYIDNAPIYATITNALYDWWKLGW